VCALFYAMFVTVEPPCILDDSVILAAGPKVSWHLELYVTRVTEHYVSRKYDKITVVNHFKIVGDI